MTRNNENSYREKGRAVFLAAIMVISVVAMSASFAGAAAAANVQSSDDPTVSYDELNNVEDQFWFEQTIEIDDERLGDIEVYQGNPNRLDIRDATPVTTVRGTDDFEIEFDEDRFEEDTRYFLVDSNADLDDDGTYDTGENEEWQISPSFFIDVQEVEFEFDDSIVNPDSDLDDFNTDLEYEEVGDQERTDTPSENWFINVSAEVDGDTVDIDDLADVFDGGDVAEDPAAVEDLELVDDDDVIQLEIDHTETDGEITWEDLNFEGADEGDYEFTFDVVDTTAEDTAEITVTEVDRDAVFDETNYEGVAGDSFEFDVEYEATDELRVEVLFIDEDVSIGNITVDFEDEADDIDDDVLTFEIDSYLLGQEGEEVTVEESTTTMPPEGAITVTYEDDGDEKELPAENIGFENAEGVDEPDKFADRFDAPMYALDYDLEVFPQIEDTDETDAAFLTLDEPSVEDIRTWVSPIDTDLDLEDSNEDVEELLELATEDDSVAEEDILVVELEATGFSYVINDQTWDDSEEVYLSFQREDVGVFDADDEFNVSEVDFTSDAGVWDDGVDEGAIISDSDNGTHYIALDTAETFDDAEFEGDEEWSVNLLVGSENPYVDSDVTSIEDSEELEASATFDVDEREIEIEGEFDDDDRLILENTADEQVEASTSVADGTEVDYRLRLPTEVLRSTVEVEDGMVADSFDLSGVDDDTELSSVRVTEDGGEDDDVEAIVVDALDPADFQITDVEPGADLTVEPGDELEIDVTVENMGDETDTKDVEFVFDGEVLATEELELASGEEETVTFDVTAPDAEGDYDWNVQTPDDESDTWTLTVEEEPPEPAEFMIVDVDPAADVTVDEGDVIEASATVENVGEEAGTDDVEFVVDGEVVASEEVDLDAGEDVTADFEIDAPAEGEYEWFVQTSDDESDTWMLTVEAEAPPEDDDDDDDDDVDVDDDDDDDDDEDAQPGFGVAVALVALLAAAMLALRRQD